MGNSKGRASKRNTDDYTRLTNLNNLVSLLEGATACNNASQLNVALEFLRANELEPEMTRISFEHCVSQVVHFHFPSEEECKHAHWDAREEETDPLWIRSSIQKRITVLKGHSKALLIVSNLRQAMKPAGRRWTRRREAAYRESIQSIEEIAASNATPGQKLSILFI
jgi:hypothetical protein